MEKRRVPATGRQNTNSGIYHMAATHRSTVRTMNNKKKKLIGKIIAHLILILGSVIMLVPFFWMLSSSFKSLGEVFVFPPTLFGERLVWENYTQISSRFDYFAYFLNSVKVSAWVVFFQVFTSATAG